MQPDPLGLGASDATNPQSLNLYSYVQNDPINLIDPSGLNEEAPIIRIPTWEPHAQDPVTGFLWWLFFGRGGGYGGGYGGGGGDLFGGGGGGGTALPPAGPPIPVPAISAPSSDPCGRPTWDEATRQGGVNDQLLNPLGLEYTWTGKDHKIDVVSPGSFNEFEARLKANGWEQFGTDPHPDHWGDNDYRKQYKGEWYHFSMGRPMLYGKPGTPPTILGSSPPTKYSLHGEEAKPGSLPHFFNFLGSKLWGIPIDTFHNPPCRKIQAGGQSGWSR